MRSLESILFATDFQQASDDALNATARLATTFDSQVSVVHVMEPFSKGVIARMREEQKRSLMVPVRRRLEEQNVKIARYCIEMGSIASCIIEKSLEYDVWRFVLAYPE